MSEHAAMSRSHVLDCRIVGGEIEITRVPDKIATPAKR
jgi:hypothetical protein